MAKALSFSPFQIASPVQLLFCLILFFLPWVEVQCSLPPAMFKDAPKEMVEGFKKESGIDPAKPISMFSQSGWQIATGDVSLGSDMKKMMEKDKGKGGGKKPGGGEAGPMPGPNLGPDPDSLNKQVKEESGSAPLLFLYPVAILAGIVCGLLPFMPMVRRIATAGCCAAAFGVIALQCLIGFPIESEMKKQNDEVKQQMGAMGKMPGAGPKGNAKDAKVDKGKTDSKADADIFRTSYQFALYLTFLLLVTAGATAFLDALAGGGGKSAKRKKSRYDDDEDEEDEEEDRPRKKRRDDDEGDERARKKKRRDEDEDEDRPRKRRRDEDEEDEDRPRKKKAASRDEDEEEERPRKRRRDEEEEEAPRKKKPQGEFTFGEEPAAPAPAAPAPPPTAPAPAAPAAAGDNPFAFDEDEPKPKKKPRPRDDDDDRPRKKRRRDDDD